MAVVPSVLGRKANPGTSYANISTGSVPTGRQWQLAGIWVACSGGTNNFFIAHVPNGGSAGDATNMVFGGSLSNGSASGSIGAGMILNSGDAMAIRDTGGTGTIIATMYGVEFPVP